MSTFGWIVIATGFLCALFLLVIALCAIAKDADEALDQRDRASVDWSNVAHLDCERRRRRGDVKNGIGGAA